MPRRYRLLCSPVLLQDCHQAPTVLVPVPSPCSAHIQTAKVRFPPVTKLLIVPALTLPSSCTSSAALERSLKHSLSAQGGLLRKGRLEHLTILLFSAFVLRVSPALHPKGILPEGKCEV